MKNIKLNLSNGYILSISNEMDEEIHDGMVEVALLDGDRTFVNTRFWLNKPERPHDNDHQDDVERFVGAKRLSNIIACASKYAERY